jgi:ubiquinone/menaquinone biosynthesis C-methylase UbiE
MSSTSKIHTQYSLIESWFYDHIITPGTLQAKAQTVMIKISELPKGAEILDIGCGGGQVIREILHIRPDLKFTGIDNNDFQLKKAKARLSEFSSSIRLIQASAQNLPLKDSSFDFVYSLASMKHWPDRRQGLLESLRVLKGGRALLLTELNHQGTLLEVRDFIRRWKIPQIFNYPLSRIYWSKIIRNSLTSNEVVVDLEALGAHSIYSRSFSGAPAFAIEAVKPGSF